MADRKNKKRGFLGIFGKGGFGQRAYGRGRVKNTKTREGITLNWFKRKKKKKTKDAVKKSFIVSPRYIGLENTYSAKTLRKHGYKIKNK